MSQEIPEEVLEKEFDRFCESWDIDNDVESMPQDDADDFQTIKGQILRYMRQGRLTLEQDSTLTVALKYSDKMERDTLSLDVSRLDLVVMDNHAGDKNAHKLNAIAAEGCGIPERLYAKVDPRDKKIVSRVVGLFLAS